ncbi:MAG: hypothetical protein IKR26_04405 [Lachnospiraceae bacterium]|nr:hypothetical protein [Lachnospiraceae bacterium]
MSNANIKVGDIVKVADWGRVYSTYTDWFVERAYVVECIHSLEAKLHSLEAVLHATEEERNRLKSELEDTCKALMLAFQNLRECVIGDNSNYSLSIWKKYDEDSYLALKHLLWLFGIKDPADETDEDHKENITEDKNEEG